MAPHREQVTGDARDAAAPARSWARVLRRGVAPDPGVELGVIAGPRPDGDGPGA